MDKERFHAVCNQTTAFINGDNGIGTLKEKTVHAVLKSYFEGKRENQEIKVGSYVADIVNQAGIIEIQTRSFDALRKKLDEFLKLYKVTLVYPIAQTKWLLWIDEKTGIPSKKHKSPKRGSPYQILYELSKIINVLQNPNLRLCIVLLDIEEYRILNGWSHDKKRGSVRFDGIPTDIIDEIYIDNIKDYSLFVPSGLPLQFTLKSYQKETKLSLKGAQAAIRVLRSVNTIKQVGKVGNAFLYERNFEQETAFNT